MGSVATEETMSNERDLGHGTFMTGEESAIDLGNGRIVIGIMTEKEIARELAETAM